LLVTIFHALDHACMYVVPSGIFVHCSN